MTSYGKTLSETITLTDVDTRVWLATPEYTETITLTGTPTWAWVVDKTYTEALSLTDSELSNPNKPLSETITLTDGDTQDQDIVQVSPNGGYISIIASESTLVATMNELIKILEREGAPRSQTQIALTQNTDGTAFNAIALVKRH